MTTLRTMQRLALEGSQDIEIRNLAAEVAQPALQKDFRTEACLCLAYVRDRIRYVRDIRTAEVLQIPRRTLYSGYGDCDDKCILLAAMLASIGHSVRFICIAMVPGRFSHVWVQCRISGRWLDLEPTEPLSCGERVPDTPGAEYLTLEL